MLTASALTRAKNCPSSLVLPRAENHNEWADAGHDEHEDWAAETLGGTLPEWVAGIVPAQPRVEVKVGYDVLARTGRIIGEGAGRDYGTPGPFEIVGSCDVAGLDGNTVVVIDWKTGFNDVEPAATNWQIWFYALALCKALNKDDARIHIVYTKTQRIDTHEISFLDLAEFGDSLLALQTMVAQRQEAKNRGEHLDTREGAWCRHCPAKSRCPSKVALLVQVAEKGLAVIGDTELTPERARAGYEQIVLIEQLVKDARARLNTYVDEHGAIDIGNGKRFGRYERRGNKKLDGIAARAAIRAVVGEKAEEFEAMAIELSTSQAAIERAAKALAEKRGATKLKKAIIDKIDELGGVSYASPSYPYGEFAASEEDEAPAVIDADSINALLESA